MRLTSAAVVLIPVTAAAQSIVLDGFERDDPSPWRYSGPGDLSIVAGRAPGSDGQKVMRLETTAALRDNRIWWGELRLGVPPVTDWGEYHFLTCWARASGHRRVHALALYLENGGKRLESHHVVLPHAEWARVVYPVTHLLRDGISMVFFSHSAAGGLPGEALDEVYEFDDLRLEGGPPAPMAGWAVPAGLAAFSHVGYAPDEPKRIFLPPGTPGPAVLSRQDGAEIRRVELSADRWGNQVADLSDLTQPGTYVLSAGEVTTEPFSVAPDAWEEPCRAVMRFIYEMRCGGEVVDEQVGHPPCHLDNCKPRVPENTDPEHWPLAQRHLEELGEWFDLVGGWHDAGIVDQYTGNTGLMTYALALLADSRPSVADEALAEAIWGGRWLVKATLPTGELVMHSSAQVRWTDNQPRTDDDRFADVHGCWPDHAMKAVAGMARLMRSLGQQEPELREDLASAVRRAVHHFHTDIYPGYSGTTFQFTSWGALAGIEAYDALDDDEARAFALFCLERLVSCQDEGNGFFYATIGRDRPFRFVHGQAIGILALVRACEALGEHENAPRWRRAVELWCDRYGVPMSGLCGGYGMMAFGLYNDDEDEAYQGQESWWARPYDPETFASWTAGPEVSRIAGRRVRLFGAHRGGNNRYLCANAAALRAAGRLLGRDDLHRIADDQLQWIHGRNPLSQCLISHVGHRSPLAYQPIIGDVFGAMYQGIGSRDGNTPFLSPNCHHTQKEIWGVCGGLYLLAVAQAP